MYKFEVGDKVKLKGDTLCGKVVEQHDTLSSAAHDYQNWYVVKYADKPIREINEIYLELA